MTKLNVFLSHLSVEAKLADVLKVHLSRDFIGLVDVFVGSDVTSIPVGTKWLSEVTDALKSAKFHVVLCSGESVSKPWINFEAGAAHLLGIPIIPLCHSGFTPAQLPVPLSDSEGAIASEAAGLRKVYEAISRKLDSSIPSVDFDAFAREVSTFEREYAKARDAVVDNRTVSDEMIRNPRVLCVSSPQFVKLGYENQLDIVLAAFPSKTDHIRVFTKKDVEQTLSTERIDIVHIATFVCPRSGDLYFSDVDTQAGISTCPEGDVLKADMLAVLLRRSRTRLVVVGSCASLALAATLVSVTNVVATKDMVSARMMAEWVKAFYGMLATSDVASSFDYATAASGTQMRLIARQRNLELHVGTTSDSSTGALVA